uniref:Uncharacterized protein n=1 Tax=Oryza sativa subsp. japonica TaxID=39947 RepID=Q6Z6S4_ORYSJ|nr:hypothetical protein [Oryza sativa Japonica Group]
MAKGSKEETEVHRAQRWRSDRVAMKRTAAMRRLERRHVQTPLKTEDRRQRQQLSAWER